MDISKHKTLLIVLIAILWIACIITGTTGHFVLGMCLGVALMFLHMILGVAKQGKVSKQFLLYPLLIWAALWLVSFILSGYFGDRFAGRDARLYGAGLPSLLCAHHLPVLDRRTAHPEFGALPAPG